MTSKPLHSALRHFDAATVSAAAMAETRSREHHLPPISVYRWWARRTEAVNGALLDAVAKECPGVDRLMVADPFVGGGVIPLSALKRKHRVYAQDLSPWVTQGLQAMLSLPDPQPLGEAFERLRKSASRLSARAYGTVMEDGSPAEIAQSLRVAVASCTHCHHRHRLFPHALVTQLKRRETGDLSAILACSHGHYFIGGGGCSMDCPTCGTHVDPAISYQPKRIVTCPACGHQESLEARASGGDWAWELVLVERVAGARRELGFATPQEIEQAAPGRWTPQRKLGRIPKSVETQVLLRHGFRTWSDLYPARQRQVLEQLLRWVPKAASSPEEKSALTMAILGSAEMAGHLSRWDRFYLKSYESMASHRFNLTTLTVEPNVLGAGLHGRGTVARRVRLFQRAARWLSDAGVKVDLSVHDAGGRRLSLAEFGEVAVVSGSSEELLLPDGCVDLVLTDPPYHDDVQYHELSLPLRAWAKLTRVRIGGEAVAIPRSTALVNHRGYRGVLERIFKELHRVLKPEGRLVFSYANREPVAWVNLFGALRASGLRPLGFSIVHSENEGDHAKRNGRACNLDLILELVRKEVRVTEHWRPVAVFNTDEEQYLLAVGDAFLRSGDIVENWQELLLKQLRAHAFVKDPVGGHVDPDAAVATPRAAVG